MSKCNLPVSLPVDQWTEVTEEIFLYKYTIVRTMA